MTVQDFYLQINGDYASVSGRFKNDEKIKKYLLLFTKEALFEKLTDSLNEKKYEDAFRNSHSMKGVCLNLGFTDLEVSSRELCESLRDGKVPDNLDELVEYVRKDYEVVKGALDVLANSEEVVDEKNEVSSDRLKNILNAMIRDAENFYLDGVDSNLAELEKCKLPDAVQEDYKKLKDFVAIVSTTDIVNTARTIISKL